jgi:hypothetical protein
MQPARCRRTRPHTAKKLAIHVDAAGLPNAGAANIAAAKAVANRRAERTFFITPQGTRARLNFR